VSGEKGVGMATRVVPLEDDVYCRVERLAHLTNRDVADLRADMITIFLRLTSPLGLYTL
jgi:hypothetical protein